MDPNTISNTPRPNKPSAFDPWLAATLLAGRQDQEYLRGLAPEHRDRTKNTVKDLELLRRLPEGRARDMALERLARYLAREWEPKGRIRIALKERAEIEGKPRQILKHDAIRHGAFVALTQLFTVQLVQLGRRRNRAVVVDGVLALDTDDCAGVASGYLSSQPTRRMSAVQAQFMIWHAVANGAQNLVWTAYAGPTRPGDLRVEHRLHWLRRRAIKHAEEWVLDGQYSVKSRVRDITDFDLEDQLPNPLDALVAAEEYAGPLREVYDLATPKQRQILDVLDELLASGLEIPDAKRLTAEKLGIQVGAIDTVFSRLRKRVRGSRPDRL